MKNQSPIPFEQFMARALHDPERGYYARRITGVGRRGDFTTAPMISDAPARAIATWAARAMRECGCHNLIEAGPGEGTLAAGVLKFLPWLVRWRTRLHLVETSAPLVERQQQLLGNRAVWHRSMTDALRACNGRAVIFSNEFVDAFPVRRFRKAETGWLEMAVHFDEAGIARESLLPPAPLPDSSAFSVAHPCGQIIEVHAAYRDYLSGWVPHWKSGRMLTMDYGNTAEHLYHRRPGGTVRAYLFQQRLEGDAIYQNPGRQDLTADVNFTDLMQWSTPWAAEQSLATLGDFLQHAGHHPFADSSGAGGAFLVLDQKK